MSPAIGHDTARAPAAENSDRCAKIDKNSDDYQKTAGNAGKLAKPGDAGGFLKVGTAWPVRPQGDRRVSRAPARPSALPGEA